MIRGHQSHWQLAPARCISVRVFLSTSKNLKNVLTSTFFLSKFSTVQELLQMGKDPRHLVQVPIIYGNVQSHLWMPTFCLDTSTEYHKDTCVIHHLLAVLQTKVINFCGQPQTWECPRLWCYQWIRRWLKKRASKGKEACKQNPKTWIWTHTSSFKDFQRWAVYCLLVNAWLWENNSIVLSW